MARILSLSLFLFISLITQAQSIVVRISQYPSSTLWEDAIRNAQPHLSEAQISAAAQCLRQKWPNPILGESYAAPENCLSTSIDLSRPPIEPVSSLSVFQTQELRPVASLRVLQVDHYWAWEQGRWHEVQKGETLTSIRGQYGCPNGWETVCDSAIVFENGLPSDGSIKEGQHLFVPPLGVYSPAPGVIKIPINRSMTLWSLQRWVLVKYGSFAEKSLLASPQVYVNNRNEFEFTDMTTRQIITIYLDRETLMYYSSRTKYRFQKYGWWQD